MKNLISILLVWIPCVLKAQLGGVYTIDPGKPADSLNYQSIKAAILDMSSGIRSDSGKVNGPGSFADITFKIADGYYTDSLRKPKTQIKHKLTFTSISGDSSKVIIESKNDMCAYYLDCVSHVTLSRDWGAVAGDVTEIKNCRVMRRYGYAGGYTLLNCTNIINNLIIGTQNHGSIVAACDTVIGNKIYNGLIGIDDCYYIKDNLIDSCYGTGISEVGIDQTDVIISGCTIHAIKEAIYIHNVDWLYIDHCKLWGGGKGSIYVYQGQVGTELTISNCFIYNDINFYYYDVDGCDYFLIDNNITGDIVTAGYTDENSWETIYMWSCIFRGQTINNSTYPEIFYSWNWTFFLNPGYIDKRTDLHVSYPLLNGYGKVYKDITDDIDYQPRDKIHPDVGADEFTPDSNLKYNIGIYDVKLTGSISTNWDIPMVAKVYNGGTKDLYNIPMHIDVVGDDTFSYVDTIPALKVITDGTFFIQSILPKTKLRFTKPGNYLISFTLDVMDDFDTSDNHYTLAVTVANNGLAEFFQTKKPYLNTYPNPATTTLNVDYQVPECGNKVISLTDNQGKTTYLKWPGNEPRGVQHCVFDIARYHLSSGVYLLSIESKEGRMSRKVVVE